jgi:hypothetical protein
MSISKLSELGASVGDGVGMKRGEDDGRFASDGVQFVRASSIAREVDSSSVRRTMVFEVLRLASATRSSRRASRR